MSRRQFFSIFPEVRGAPGAAGDQAGSCRGNPPPHNTSKLGSSEPQAPFSEQSIHYPHFIEEETKAQRGSNTCPRSHSQGRGLLRPVQVAGSGAVPRCTAWGTGLPSRDPPPPLYGDRLPAQSPWKDPGPGSPSTLRAPRPRPGELVLVVLERLLQAGEWEFCLCTLER